MSDPDLDVLRRTAELARLSIDADEAAGLARDFARILEAFRELAEVDVADTEPRLAATELSDVLRADEPRPSLPREALLAPAPEPRDGSFGVPRTIEDAP